MDLIVDLINEQGASPSDTVGVDSPSKKRPHSIEHNESLMVTPVKVAKDKFTDLLKGSSVSPSMEQLFGETEGKDPFSEVAEEETEDDEATLDEVDPRCSLIEVLEELEDSHGSEGVVGTVVDRNPSSTHAEATPTGASVPLPASTPNEPSMIAGSSGQRTPTRAEQQQQEAENNRAEDRKLLALMAHFNDDQLNRFEMFRRATFTKSSVSRLIQSVSPSTFSQNVVIAMAGITKVFVGEIVETALDFRDELKETGPLQPKHIRVAFSRLREQQRTSRPNRANLLR